MLAFVVPFFLPTASTAACYIDGASGRLGNYCSLSKIQGARVGSRTVRLIDYKLKREGNSHGLGLPLLLKANSTSVVLNPILSYSDNINGGNSPEPLVLGSLAFYGDENLHRKEGVVIGFDASLNGRYIHSEGKYLTYGVNASYVTSPKYGLGIVTTSASVSSINHIKDGWYLDIRANTTLVRKDITDNKSSNLSFMSSKVYASSEVAYSEASFGVNRYFAQNYTQDQLVLKYKTIHTKSVHSDVSVTLGEAIESKLATKMYVGAKITSSFAKKPLTLSASFTNASGGMLLGFERSDKTFGIGATYPLWRGLTASVGYKATDSTIDYFDVSTPTFGISFPSIDF